MNDAEHLINLAKQYGEEMRRDLIAGLTPGDETQAILARIAALMPQQPVQAHHLNHLWWQHECGQIVGIKAGVEPNEDDCPACEVGKPGPWRPLLVAAPDGDRTPEPVDLEDALDQAVGDYEAARAKLLEVVGERDQAQRMRDFLADQVVAPSREALDAVGAPNQLRMADRILQLASQRDEARAEIERLKAAYERAVDARLADAFDRLRDKAKLIKEFGPQFGAFLARERVELAPPREPRTAAEIWRDIPAAQAVLRERPGFRHLVEALDREARL